LSSIFSKLSPNLHVKVRFVGFLARKIGREISVELDEGTTFAEAVRRISREYGFGPIDLEKGSDPDYLIVLLNGRSHQPDVKLKEGDEIAFLPPIAGG